MTSEPREPISQETAAKIVGGEDAGADVQCCVSQCNWSGCSCICNTNHCSCGSASPPHGHQ